MTAKILYVDDNPMSVDLVRRQLVPYNVEFITAYTGETALKQANKHLPDVILMDVQLPDIDGVEVMMRLRAEAHTVAIPILMMTGHISPRTRQYAERMGCNEYLIKPVNIPTLLEALQSYISLA